MKPVLFLFSLMLALTGCAGVQSHRKAAAIDETIFAGMWNLYQHCKTNDDPELLRFDALRLGLLASATLDPYSSLPAPLIKLVSNPPLRLAVDPKALAADCALRGGRVATEEGRPDLAGELFLSVMKRHQEIEYAYYVEQARVGLAQLVSGIPPTLKPIPVSSPQ